MEVEALVGEGLSIHGILDSTHVAVSTALRDVRAHLSTVVPLSGLDPTWEIVVAEILNNIVEHAYGERGDGEIHLRLIFAPGSPGALRAEFTDFGRAMPQQRPPAPCPPNLDVARDQLPEGGFGWSLIHALVTRLDYSRGDGRNRLALEMPLR